MPGIAPPWSRAACRAGRRGVDVLEGRSSHARRRSQVRTGLAAGRTRIHTLGPRLRRGASLWRKGNNHRDKRQSLTVARLALDRRLEIRSLRRRVRCEPELRNKQTACPTNKRKVLYGLY